METINGNNSNKHGNKFIMFVLLGGDVGILVDNGKNMAMGKWSNKTHQMSWTFDKGHRIHQIRQKVDRQTVGCDTYPIQ